MPEEMIAEYDIEGLYWRISKCYAHRYYQEEEYHPVIRAEVSLLSHLEEIKGAGAVFLDDYSNLEKAISSARGIASMNAFGEKVV